MSKKTVLVLDDDGSIRTVLNQALTRAGFDVRLASTVAALNRHLDAGRVDCVVSDVILPDGDAFVFIPEIRIANPQLPIILISAQNTFTTTLKAEKSSVFEYLPKPFDIARLVEAVERAVLTGSGTSVPGNKHAIDKSDTLPIVGRSPAMQAIYQSIARLSDTDLPVMVSGGPGTGKSLVAQVLHDFSSRCHGPFVTLDLTTMSTNEVETRLFGSASEAMRSDLWNDARGGTLFLREIGNLSSSAQRELTQRLSENTEINKYVSSANPRIIVSTLQEPDQLLATQGLRHDLYYELSAIILHIPELSERMEELPDLARHFIEQHRTENGVSHYLDADALKVLKQRPWLGNVRELKNLIRRLCVLHPTENITSEIVRSELMKSGVDVLNEEKPELKTLGEQAVNAYFQEFAEVK